MRRFLEGTAAVAVWMALGMAFPMSAFYYLLIGIPITILFQLFVRRAPLRAMWVRDAPPFRLGVYGVIIALLVVLVPIYNVVHMVTTHSKDLGVWIWSLVAIAGAVPVAYALRHFRREAFRDLLLCLATAGTIGCLIMIVFVHVAGPAHHASLSTRIGVGVEHFFLYIPVVFFYEEVWFRGLLDAHLHHPGESRGIASAMYVSALWGLWHYPIFHRPHTLHAFPGDVARLILVQVLVGTFLSIYWRRSGNLFVTGSVHALIDAVRDALFV